MSEQQLKASKFICVFCGSSTGANPVYAQAAQDLGKAIASENWGLVYGGGTTG